MDYFKILNLNKDPFSNSPDPELFYRSEQHFACLTKLQNAIYSHRGGLNLVIGDVGTGKTTLGRQLIRILSNDNAYETHLIFDPAFDTPRDCLTQIAELFGSFGGTGESEGHHKTDEPQMKKQIAEYLLRKRQDEQKTTVLIIDEGQKIPGFCLEILNEFLNYEKTGNALLQVVILAQIEFETTLKEYTTFAGSISLHLKLGPMNFRDTRQMIQFRMNQSAGNENAPSLFSYQALWGIYRHTKGFPRKIIHICHQSILMMIIANRTKVGWFLLQKCIRKQKLGKDKNISWVKPVAVFGALAVIIGAIIGISEKKQVSANNNDNPLLTMPISPRDIARQHNNHSKMASSQVISAENRKGIVVPPIDLEEPVQINDPVSDTRTIQESHGTTERDRSGLPGYRTDEGDSTIVGDSTPVVELVTTRGARHEGFFRIVLEFSEKMQYEEPVVYDNQAIIRLHNIKTRVKTFRKYKNFNSWLALDQKGNDIDVRIGLPENMLKYTCFKLDEPWRLVIDVFTPDSET